MKRNFIRDWAMVAVLLLLWCKCAHGSIDCNKADPNLKTEGRQIYMAALKEYKAKKSTKDPRVLQPIQDEYPWRMIRDADLQYLNATGRLP